MENLSIIFISSKDNGDDGKMLLRGENVLVRVSDSVKRLLEVILRDLFESYHENIIQKSERN